MGLTGAGKSTLLPTLLEGGRTLLPERRQITDRVILPAAQRMEGVPPGPVTDRLERFRLTARYREKHPEGIVHALTQELTGQPLTGPAVFDGLRGQSEVAAATSSFPRARFLMLLARPLTRVKRLMFRDDQFDQVNEQVVRYPVSETSELQERIQEIEGVDQVLDPLELVHCWQDRPERADDLLRAVRIVVAEQQNYGEEPALACLEQLPAQRRLVVDSEVLGPVQVAERVRGWLSANGGE